MLCPCHSVICYPLDCVLPFFTTQTDCGMNVHSNCQKKVANLCGINQKLLAEALTQVSQVCTAQCCVHYSECYKGRRNSIIFNVISFFLFRSLSRSLKTQIQQTLESTKMSVMQQQTLVVSFTHCRTRSWTISTIHWIQNGSYNFLPKILSLKRSNAFILASVWSICGHLSNYWFIDFK